jgi:hypothetical protein
MRDLPIFPSPSAALLLPLLSACGDGKDGAEACESLMTALCAAGDANTCGLGEPTAGACSAWGAGAELELPALTAEAAEACVELLEAPECGSALWVEAVAGCAQLPGACVQRRGGGGEDSGEPWDSGTWYGPSSCDWIDLGLCFEFDGYSGAEAWCTEAARSYGTPSAFYGREGCASGGEGPCLLPPADDLPVPVQVYYYEVDDPQRLCEGAGGTWLG